MYTALVERDDGTTYEQRYNDIYDLIDLMDSLGEEYQICDIY